MLERSRVLPHNDFDDDAQEDIASPCESVEMLLNRGATMDRKRREQTKRLSKRVTVEQHGDLVEQISLDILMDKHDDDQSQQHKESIKNLLKLTGIVDSFDLGDPETDRQIMNVICGVIENFNPNEKTPKRSRKSKNANKASDQATFFQAQMLHHDTLKQKKELSQRSAIHQHSPRG